MTSTGHTILFATLFTAFCIYCIMDFVTHLMRGGMKTDPMRPFRNTFTAFGVMVAALIVIAVALR